MQDLKEKIDLNRLPRHIAIIMDGTDDGQKKKVRTGFMAIFMELKV